MSGLPHVWWTPRTNRIESEVQEGYTDADDLAVRVRVLQNLAWVRPVHSLPLLKTVLADQQKVIREFALRALAEIGTDECMALLANAANDPDVMQYELALQGLDGLGDEHALDMVARSLQHQEPLVRALTCQPAAQWAAEGSRRAMGQLVTALRDPKATVRVTAAEQIIFMEEPAARQALLDYLPEEKDARTYGRIIAGIQDRHKDDPAWMEPLKKMPAPQE